MGSKFDEEAYTERREEDRLRCCFDGNGMDIFIGLGGKNCVKCGYCYTVLWFASFDVVLGL